MNFFLKNYMLKEQCGIHMVEIFYIGFFFVNHKKNANVKCPHTMKCIICYSSLIIYYTTNEIIILKKPLNANHFIIAKMFEKEVNNPLKGEVEKQLAKKKIKSIWQCYCQLFYCQITFPKISYATKKKN